MKYWRQILVGAAVAASIFSFGGCNKNNDGNTSETDSLKRDLIIKNYLKSEYMDVYYYWSDYVPDNVNASSMSIYDYFDALLYSKDRWSWMMDRDNYITMATGTVSSSFGVSYGQMVKYYGDYDIRVKYVIEGGPMYNAGVRRGWVLDSLGGKEMMSAIRDGTYQTLMSTSPQTFTFTDLEGKNHVILSSQCQKGRQGACADNEREYDRNHRSRVCRPVVVENLDSEDHLEGKHQDYYGAGNREGGNVNSEEG